MKRHGKITIHPKFILIFLTLISAALIIISLLNNNAFSPLQNAVSVVLTPAQKGLNQIGLWFTNKAETLNEITRLKEENEKLQAEIDELRLESTFTSQMKNELNALRELYELDSIYDDYPKVAARVISANSDNWFSEFIIDKGQEDGLEVDMNVIAGSGLVGRITYVGKNYSKVSTIISDGHNVSAKLLDSSENCIVTGDLTLISQNLIKVSNLNIEAEVQDGDKLVTSYISDKYVPGLLIGYVSGFTPDGNNMTQSGYLTPAVDFRSIEEVLVITQLKVTGDD